MTIDDLLDNGWEAFADSYGNNGYITSDVNPCFVLIYDDDAFHCRSGHGYAWRVYEDIVPEIEDIVYDMGAADTAYGFESFEEALADLEEQYDLA